MANQNSLPDYLTNPSNPYFLHPNESPSLALVSSLLNGKNYHTWKGAVTMVLISKNKLCFVDGTENSPEVTDPLFPAWYRCNNMVLSWIHHSIEDSIVNSIMWMDLASDVWRDLSQRFSQSSIFRISELLEDIHRLEQGERSVSDFFTQLKSLWDELEILQPLPVCRCNPSCSCGAMVQVRASRERIQVIRLLKGLNEQFALVRSQIMLMEPLPNLNKVFSLVAQQERQLNSDSQVDTFADSKAFVSSRGVFRGSIMSRGRGRTGSGRGCNNKLCTHCGKTNHTVDTCYEKHGYPPGYKTRSNPRSANAALQEADTDSSTSKVEHDSSGVMLSQNQYQRFLELLEHHNDADNNVHSSNIVQTSNASNAALNADTQASESEIRRMLRKIPSPPPGPLAATYRAPGRHG